MKEVNIYSKNVSFYTAFLSYLSPNYEAYFDTPMQSYESI